MVEGESEKGRKREKEEKKKKKRRESLTFGSVLVEGWMQISIDPERF